MGEGQEVTSVCSGCTAAPAPLGTVTDGASLHSGACLCRCERRANRLGKVEVSAGEEGGKEPS